MYSIEHNGGNSTAALSSQPSHLYCSREKSALIPGSAQVSRLVRMACRWRHSADAVFFKGVSVQRDAQAGAFRHAHHASTVVVEWLVQQLSAQSVFGLVPRSE